MYKTYLIFPDNYAWSLSAATSLHLGGTMGELMALCQTLQDASRVGPSGDLDAWEAGWSELAERVFRMAQEEEEKGCHVSAGETYKRAAAYFHSAERMLPGKSKRRVELFVRHQEAFAKYAKYRRPPMEYVTFPYENTEIGGYFIPALGAKQPAPCVASFGGLDTTAETIAARSEGLDERGIHCLAVDGPGWGASLKLRGMHTRHDYEVVAAAVVDYLETRPDVDSKRLGQMAISLGGYYAPRIAAFEKRFKAGVAWAGKWNHQESVMARVKQLKEKDPHMALSADRSHALWVFGVETWEELIEVAAKFNLDGVAQKITSPFLVVHGENDRQNPVSNAYKLYEAISSKDKELKIFTIKEGRGGIEHCQWDNPDLARHYMYDWFAKKLK